jgi:hypothetical protein
MQLRNYAKKYQVELTEVTEALQANFSNTQWLKTSNLNDSHIQYRNSVFGSLQLPANQERLQLPEAKNELAQRDSKELAQQDYNDLAEQTEQPEINLDTNRVEQLLSAGLSVEKVRVNQLLNDHYTDLSNTVDSHYNRVEQKLLTHLKTNYEVVKNHQPKERATHDSSEFDSMLKELESVGVTLDSKSK